MSSNGDERQRPRTQHDSKWCPECDTRGRIADISTRENAGNDWDRIRSRVFECPDCSGRWESYA